MFFGLFQRKARAGVLVEVNPYQVLVAVIARPDRETLTISAAAAFELTDATGLSTWLENNAFRHGSWLPTICSVVSADGVIQRETVHPRNLSDPEYLPRIAAQAAGIGDPRLWTFHAVNPLDGLPLEPENSPRPALICGFLNSEIQRTQNRLLEQRLMPERIHPGLLALFGALISRRDTEGDRRSAVVILIEETATVACILGREGVHTTAPLQHGLSSILQAARRELHLTTDVEALARLRRADSETRSRASRFVRALGRHLKPLIDSYEMSTGQPAGGIFCASLPADLAWLAEPLAEAVERPLIQLDAVGWLRTLGIRVAPGVPAFGPNWVGALSLLPGSFGNAQGAELQSAGQRPWRTDFRMEGDLPNNQFIGRHFMPVAVAGALAAFALIAVLWQGYALNILRNETRYWEEELEKNRPLFANLSRTSNELQAGAARLDHAYNLMATPVRVSDFIINLGKTLPPNMRIERIELAGGRITLAGGLKEPSEMASATLRDYRETLQKAESIGPLFETILLTSLQREEESDSMRFEITFRPRGIPQ